MNTNTQDIAPASPDREGGRPDDAARLDAIYFKLCGALSWAYTPGANIESVEIAAAELVEQFLYNRARRADELRALGRVIKERDDYRKALEVYADERGILWEDCEDDGEHGLARKFITGTCHPREIARAALSSAERRQP